MLGPTITCRPAVGACDVAEVHDDQSVDCPEDIPASDGVQCEVGTCEAGVCIPDGETTGDPTGGDAAPAPPTPLTALSGGGSPRPSSPA